MVLQKTNKNKKQIHSYILLYLEGKNLYSIAWMNVKKGVKRDQ